MRPFVLCASARQNPKPGRDVDFGQGDTRNFATALKETVLNIFQRELDLAHEEGGLYVLTMHLHHIGYRSRIFILDEIIRHAKSLPGVWFASHEEIARWCATEAGLPARA